MYISKLLLQGFKSFLHKTHLEFGEGVTAVVGPNGCGKSNIVDAIRWVLGEQKISILRSAKMEDVIFNGTKKRKPLSFCEASLLIHNNRGILPIEFNNVEITRRLYRSGESEFYINKTLCRLKDIQNLFVDTGMSSNAYSVIELKMVDSILSHNASDRREMFEEAAGINYYKQQRQAALKKMSSTRIDMERVNDIVLGVNNSIKNLRLQVKRFERYEILIEKQKVLNIETASAEIQIIKSKQAPLEEKLKQIKSKQSNLSGQMNLDETMIEKTQSKFEKKKAELSKYQYGILKLESEITDLNTNLLVWSEKILGNNNQKLHFQDGLQHNGDNLSTSENKIYQLNKEKEKLLPAIKQSSKDFNDHKRKFRKVNVDYEKKLIDQEELKKKTETIFLKIRDEEGALERLKNTIKEMEQNKEKQKEKISYFHQNMENSKAEINLVRVDLDKQEKENVELSTMIDNLQTKHSKFEKNILILNEKRSQLQSQQSTLEAQLDFYKNIIDNHEGRPAGVKRILMNHDKFPFVVGVLSDIIEVDDNYKTAVESALGEYNNFLVVNTRENAQKLFDQSSQRLSILTLDTIPQKGLTKRKYPAKSILSTISCDAKIKKLLDILLWDVCILSEKDVKTDIDTTDSWNWVSLAGRYFSRGFIYKSCGKGSDSVIGRKQKLKHLDKNYVKVEKQVQKINSNLETVIKDANVTYKTSQLKTDELDSNIKKLNGLEQKLNRQDYISAKHQDSILEIRESQKNADKQFIDYNSRLERAKDSIYSLRLEYKVSSEQYDVFQITLAKKRSMRTNQQQILQNARIKLLEIEKEKEGLIYRIDTFTSQKKALTERIKKYDFELLRIDKENKVLTNSIFGGKEKLLELSNSLELSNKEKDELEKAYNKSYKEFQRLQYGIRERQKEKDEFLTSLRQYEIAVAEGLNEIQHHRSRIRELYNEELTDEPIFIEEFNLASHKAGIETIERSLDRIGPVNLAVADEYEKESERYTFITRQYADLEQSKKTIQETIEKLDGEAKTKFMDTFNAIQENFSKTYSSFFNGGKGNLRLVGEDDPLEAEIEIIAQPPGKKTQTLRMLSAGEKALTAIALLFAIYLVKPSPFCILDEVDAPLDDTNIGKFATVLKEFSNKTQFIVVTHNKLTMEKADFMYGITQQEEGVSKIVSVKLKQGEIDEAHA